MSYKARSTGWRKYLSTASTQAAFSLAAGSVSLSADIALHQRDDAFYTETSSSSVLRGEFMSGWRGMVFRFFGTAAENLTADYKLWVFNYEKTDRGLDATGHKNVTSYMLTLWCSGTLTTGNTATAGIAGTSSKWVDTATLSMSAEGTVFETAQQLGNTTVHSPAADSIASLVVPHISDVTGWILEFDMTGAASMNALWRLTR